ncbi:tyrosine-type recombinase/integrase [Leclercia adecarboxylata]|uniref:tyrosine-type recombinase/integrase n=1 Tax=Leclercia adecarboxylata TaxID=83655 RepID=UPI0030198C4D
MQSLPDLYPIFIQQNVHFLDRTASSERSFMWQRRLAGKVLRVSLRTQDKTVAQYRAVKLTEAFIRLSQLMGDTNPRLIHETLLKARDKHIEDEFLSAVTACHVSPYPVMQENNLAPLLSSVLKEWLEEMSSGWAKSTKVLNERTVNGFLEWCGDITIDSVTKKTVSNYKKFLDDSGKSPRSKQDAIIKVSAMFNFAMKQRDYIAKNPFLGMNYKNVENVSIKKGVSLMEHQKIIACQHVADSRILWWLLNLLYYTGVRIGEAIQITSNDYIEKEDQGKLIKCISINDNGTKTVKNNESIRDIPLSDSLLKAGIWEEKPIYHWVNNSSASNAISKAFKKAGMKHTAHDYRYGLSDRLRDLQAVPDHIRFSILGHAHQTMTDRTYRSKQPLLQMKEVIDRI